MSLKITQYDSSKLPQIEEVQDLYVALKNYTNNFTEKLTDSSVIKQDQELIEILELLDFDFEAAKVKGGGKKDDVFQYKKDVIAVLHNTRGMYLFDVEKGKELATDMVKFDDELVITLFNEGNSPEVAANQVYENYLGRLKSSVQALMQTELNYTKDEIKTLWTPVIEADLSIMASTGMLNFDIFHELKKKHRWTKAKPKSKNSKLGDYEDAIIKRLVSFHQLDKPVAEKMVVTRFMKEVDQWFNEGVRPVKAAREIEKVLSELIDDYTKLVRESMFREGLMLKNSNAEKEVDHYIGLVPDLIADKFYNDVPSSDTASSLFNNYMMQHAESTVTSLINYHDVDPAKAKARFKKDDVNEFWLNSLMRTGTSPLFAAKELAEMFDWPLKSKAKPKRKKSFSQYVDDVLFIIQKRFADTYKGKEAAKSIVNHFKSTWLTKAHERDITESEAAKTAIDVFFESFISDEIAARVSKRTNDNVQYIETLYYESQLNLTDFERYTSGDEIGSIVTESTEKLVQYYNNKFKEDTKPKPKTKPKMDNKLQALQNALAQLMEDADIKSGVKEEDVKNIIKAFMDKYKISEAQLDEELRVKINNVRKIKIATPKFESKEFSGDDENPNLLKIIDDIMLGHAVMFIGGAGTGKTFLAEKIADKILGRGFNTINCSQWTSPVEIIGGETIEGFKEGKLIDAWKNGKILILDELPKIDPNTAGLLNEALAKIKEKSDGSTQYIQGADGKKHAKHKDFGVMATGNVYPNTESIAYGANNKQDLSLLDRFAGSVYFIEKNPKFEKEFIGLMIWSICDKLRSVIETNKYEAQMSLRFMQVARDTYNVEMARVNGDAGKDAPDANEGKTLKAAIDSFLSTFTDAQIKVLKTAINYSKNIESYQYRKADYKKLLIK